MGLPEPVLRFTDGTKTVDILAPGSGWKMSDPYWNPQIAQYKRGGFKINPSIAEGQRLVHKEYDNVIETIPIEVNGPNQNLAIATINELLSLGRQAADYWAESYEFDDVWMEVAPACEGALVGYARIIQMRIPELINPYGQPFFSSFNEVIMTGLTLTVEREPLWRAIPPGQIIGPLYNLIKNPDFELWNFGVGDSQPDSWTDLETAGITGQNGREINAPHSGLYSLKIAVTQSLAAGRAKGVTQILANVPATTECTVIAWVRSEGVSNGVGRILVTYGGQLELYRSATQHGWTLYADVFTPGGSDVVAINCEILTTAANCVGTIYVDSLMILPGNFITEAENGTLPYISGSHIVNHWDQADGTAVEAGDINYVDVWDIPGNESALVRIETRNNNTLADPSTPTEVIGLLRIGMRRAGDINGFINYFDPPGVADTTASSDDRVEFNPNNSFRTVATKQITGTVFTQNTAGRYRVIARVFDAKSSGDPTLQARLQYWLGAANTTQIKTLQSVTAPIRNQWTTVNLTENAALNFDTKFSIQDPGALNFSLQYLRQVGSGLGYLDYIILLPTDGGYLQATINPAVVPGEGVIVDNTLLQSVNVSGLQIGYVTKFDATAVEFWRPRSIFKEYKGNLYVGAFAIAGNTANIYRKVGNTWTSVKSSANQDLHSLEIYNGLLYAGGTFDGVDRLIATSEGTVWSNIVNTVDTPFVLKSFDSYLWVAIHDGTDTFIYRWNGSTLALSFTILGKTPFDMAVYGNRLYLTASTQGAEPGNLYSYNPITDSWSFVTVVGTAITQDATSMEVFNGKLYIATADNGEIFSWDGSTLATVYDPNDANLGISELLTFNEKLYATTEDFISGGSGKIIVSDDGITWETIYADSNFSNMFAMYGYNGAIYVALFDNSIGTSVFSIVVNESYQYGVTDYQLVPFYSPPKKRHRFFFNWDRANRVNNIDDAALIGLGFVPRYLALRGNR